MSNDRTASVMVVGLRMLMGVLITAVEEVDIMGGNGGEGSLQKTGGRWYDGTDAESKW